MSFLFPLSFSALVLLILRPGNDVDAEIYTVNPDGDNGAYTLSQAMELAGPGDTVELTEGIYEEQLESVRDGEENNAIVVTGGIDAVIMSPSSPSVVISHSYVHLVGFSVDGFVGSGDSTDSFIDKCVWVEGEAGTETTTPIEGFAMRNMLIENCGSECIRLKNFVTGAIISGNTIKNCGIYDYQLDGGEKNGEGIYVGTSINQWENGIVDVCDFNYVSGNTIETNGNECVDVKEGSTYNVIESNVCSMQLDENSGCFGSRGNANTFRFNRASNCMGAGVRLGSEPEHPYGYFNNVYANEIINAEYGSVKVETGDQGLICGNICEEGVCEVTGDYAETIETTLEACNVADFALAMEEEPALQIVPTPSPSSSPSPTSLHPTSSPVSSPPTPSPTSLPPTPSPTPSPTRDIDDDDDDGNDDGGNNDDDDGGDGGDDGDDDDDDGDDDDGDDGDDDGDDDDDDDDDDDGDDDDDDDDADDGDDNDTRRRLRSKSLSELTYH